MAAAPKRPRALSTDEATAPNASRIGESSMIRVRRTVSSVLTMSKPGVMIGTITGAQIATMIENTTSSSSMKLSTVDTTRHARSSSLCVNRPASTGISAEPSAPAATSWKIASGRRKAAK